MKDLDNIYTYHKPSALQNMKYDMIRAYAKQLADAIETVCPDSRERSLAHTNLEQATMWANASIARNGDPEPVASPFDVPPGSVKAVPDKDPPFMHKPRLVRSTGDYPHRTIQKVARDYPPDVFDFVATGEMVEAPEPEPTRQTARFARITKSPEAFATFMNEELDRCPPKVVQSDCADNPDCVKCWTDWLNEEVTPDD